MRVRVHSYRQQGNDWLPFLEDGRQIHLAAQPGGQEAFLALTGSTIRDESAGSADQMRQFVKAWRR